MPLLLHLSKLLLLSPRVRSEGQPLLVKPAALRCLFIQQQLLESRSSSLWVEVEDLVKGLDTALGDETGLPRQVLMGRYLFIFMGVYFFLLREVQSGLYLELGHVSLYYLQYEAAKV